VELRIANGSTLFGVGIDRDTTKSALKAVLSGVNRILKR
jgi:2-isopropylmalate synthase